MSVKQHIVDMADGIKKEIVFKKDSGTIEEKEGVGVYEQFLPEGLTIEIVESVNKYDYEFGAATKKAVGDMAVEEMSRDKKLETVTGTFGMTGKDSVTHTVSRKVEYKNPAKPDEPVIKYGAITTTFTKTSTRNSGQIKAVGAAVCEAAAELLG